MIRIDHEKFDALAELVGDTPFTVTPYFLLRQRACKAFVNSEENPRCTVVLPLQAWPDVYVVGARSLAPTELDELAGFLAKLDNVRGYFVPVELVPRIRALRPIHLEVEGLCFSYRQLPSIGTAWRPEMVRRLGLADKGLAEALPDEASFLFDNFGTPTALLREGLAFGVFAGDQLVSMCASLVLTPKHCDVGVYTRRRHRHRGFATDCVEALFAHVIGQGMRPLWRIGVRQKIAIYFAEKLDMDEIGTDGQEVYLQTYSAR